MLAKSLAIFSKMINSEVLFWQLNGAIIQTGKFVPEERTDYLFFDGNFVLILLFFIFLIILNTVLLIIIIFLLRKNNSLIKNSEIPKSD